MFKAWIYCYLMKDVVNVQRPFVTVSPISEGWGYKLKGFCKDQESKKLMIIN